MSSSVEAPFQGIWDRGALGAVNYADRAAYATLLQSLMAPDCKYLINTFTYNEQEYAGWLQDLILILSLINHSKNTIPQKDKEQLYIVSW